MTLQFCASLQSNRSRTAALLLACVSGISLAIARPSAAQTAPPASAAPKTSPPSTDGKESGKDDANARKVMRDERDTLLKQRAEMDKRIRELDKKLLGEDFGDDPVAPNAGARVFVMPRSLYVPGNATQNVLPPHWDQDVQKRMQELNRTLRQNFQTFGNGFTFNGNTMRFGNIPGVKSFEFQSTNDPNRPFVFRLDGIDIDDKAFDKHLEELKKTDPEREKQLRTTRDQLREAEQKLQNGLRSLPRNAPAAPKTNANPASPAPAAGKYI